MAIVTVYYIYKWISLGSIEETASATRTPIAEETRGAEEERGEQVRVRLRSHQ